MNRSNDLVRRTVLHTFEQIIERAKLTGFDGMAEELNTAFKEQDQRLASLEARLDQLEAQQPIAKA